MGGWAKSNATILGIVAAVAAIVLVAVFAFDLRVSSSDGSDELEPNYPKTGPAEFLYLDSARVAAYLAQVKGGTADSEKLTKKYTDTLSAKLSLEKAGELGRSKAIETSIERILKPTAASSFFALLGALERKGAVEPIRLRYFNEDLKKHGEGEFVSFETSSLLPPVYLSAFLAVKHAHTLGAIFPSSKARREAARNFFTKVGRNPRVVFALQPFATPEEQKKFDVVYMRQLRMLEGKARASEATPPRQRKPFVYLLPVGAQLLSSERSLLKYGGGKFTVVGKMVRRFPEPTRKHRPAYVDSPTLETWEQAIRRAPGELLCRTAPACAAEVRESDMTGAERKAAIGKTRRRILAALKAQTSIEHRGAVILPLAIYK